MNRENLRITKFTNHSNQDMQRTGVCFQAYIPMRKEASEASEMVSQVIFGESFSVLEESPAKNFSYIRLHHDNYEGWVTTRCIFYFNEKEWEHQVKLPVAITHELTNLVRSVQDSLQLPVGSGSILRVTSPGKTKTPEGEFHIPVSLEKDSSDTRKNIIMYGDKLLGVPYIWGGRSSFGMDCSGLCQNLYRQAGIEIPRDAALQATRGKPVNFIEEAKPGDLAFFDDSEGKITHVGMIIGNGKILHASGKVRIDSIDHQGIFSTELNRYSHKLRLLKNLIGN